MCTTNMSQERDETLYETKYKCIIIILLMFCVFSTGERDYISERIPCLAFDGRSCDAVLCRGMAFAGIW